MLLLPVFLSAAGQQHKVGIVLSGGGALGFAHIGVLQALEESGIRPTIIAGASMGSLVGALYASGMSPLEIYHVAKGNHFDHSSSILAPIIKRGQLGISSQKKVDQFLRVHLPHNSFDSLKLPLYVSVTNLTTNKSEFISTGDNLIPYLLASSAIPVVFEAVEMDSMIYVDGGVLNNFPAQAIRKKCRVLIGVDVTPNFEDSDHLTGIIEMLGHTLHTLVHNNSIPGRQLCNHLIEPNFGKEYSVMSFKFFEEIYQHGYTVTKAYLAEHPSLVKQAKTN
ncbi:MAG: patatin-like phospholipase family protein [Prevotellaceae bacterium]|jgi:NTE family protein|nr:patatin-like phospholipase family protein [Prevotellaceae bacterium]